MRDAWGFLLSSPFSIDPPWIAVVGAVAISLPALAQKTPRLLDLARALEPTFLVFVLGLRGIVAAASDNGLARTVHTLLPSGGSLVDLPGVAAVSGVLANVIDNLPAILILAPAVASTSHTPARRTGW